MDRTHCDRDPTTAHRWGRSHAATPTLIGYGSFVLPNVPGQHLKITTSHQVFTTMPRHEGADSTLVFLIGTAIFDIDIDKRSWIMSIGRISIINANGPTFLSSESFHHVGIVSIIPLLRCLNRKKMGQNRPMRQAERPQDVVVPKRSYFGPRR